MKKKSLILARIFIPEMEDFLRSFLFSFQFYHYYYSGGFLFADGRTRHDAHIFIKRSENSDEGKWWSVEWVLWKKRRN